MWKLASALWEGEEGENVPWTKRGHQHLCDSTTFVHTDEHLDGEGVLARNLNCA